jgi:neutral ceramidase
VGDTTPNVLGAYCDDGSGQMCDLKTSTCGGTSQACHGRGPFFQNLDLGVTSGFEIGRRQFAGAQSLYVRSVPLARLLGTMIIDRLQSNLDSTGTTVVGTSVKSFHTYQNMSFWQFTLPNGTQAQTCPAALGHSFAAGTTDGM